MTRRRTALTVARLALMARVVNQQSQAELLVAGSARRGLTDVLLLSASRHRPVVSLIVWQTCVWCRRRYG